MCSGSHLETEEFRGTSSSVLGLLSHRVKIRNFEGTIAARRSLVPRFSWSDNVQLTNTRNRAVRTFSHFQWIR